MKPELGYKALRLYGKKFGVPSYKSEYISYPFIPLFRRMGYVWIHAASVVRFCHLQNPNEFGVLNQFSLIRIANIHQVMNNGRSTRSFRLIKQDEFERVTGIEL